MRPILWEDLAHYQRAEVERTLAAKARYQAALEAIGPQEPFFQTLRAWIGSFVTSRRNYGLEAAKNCCTAAKSASAASV